LTKKIKREKSKRERERERDEIGAAVNVEELTREMKPIDRKSNATHKTLTYSQMMLMIISVQEDYAAAAIEGECGEHERAGATVAVRIAREGEQKID
jgi:hypothetical protein